MIVKQQQLLLKKVRKRDDDESVGGCSSSLVCRSCFGNRLYCFINNFDSYYEQNETEKQV